MYRRTGDPHGNRSTEEKVCRDQNSRRTIHNYLGLVIDFTEAPIVTLNQTGMIEDIITSTKIAVDTARSDGSKVNLKVGPRSTRKTPAPGYLFNITEGKEPLCDSSKTIFHTVVAKLIFLANRTRADILTAISFLAKRVLYPAEEDWEKLTRTLSYLEATKLLKLKIGRAHV